MGINGLESFCNNYVENGLQKFNILDEIAEWKKRNNDKHPVILIDVEIMIKGLVQSCIESLILGGRHNIYYKKLDAFLKKLLTLGVSLVFFERGMEKYDFEWFAENEEKDYEKYVKILTELDLGAPSLPQPRNTYWMSLSTEMREIAEKYGQFHLTFNDHNEDMATYAITHENVLAIWGRDSDLLLFHAISHIQYWSLAYDHLNFIDFTTHRFDIAAVQKSLGLSTNQQVSMFGAILHFYYNNSDAPTSMADFFHDQKLRECHYKWNIIKRKQTKFMSINILRIRNVAEFVHKNVSTERDVSDDDFAKVSNAILGTHSNKTTIDRIEEEYKRYDIANFPAPPEPLVYSARNCNFINKMLNNWRFQLFDIKFTDFRPMLGFSYIDLLLPFYQKQAGIILQHKQSEFLKCKFSIKMRHETPIEKVDKEPIYPEIRVPDLQQLYDDRNDDEDIEAIKWQLLSWILGIKRTENNVSAIKSMKEKYLVVVVLTIRHLLKSKAISHMTADALFVAESETLAKDNAENEESRDNDVKELEGIDAENGTEVFPSKINGRTIRNAHLYNIVRKMINDCMQTCGLRAFIEIPRFDGLLFHNTVEQLLDSGRVF